MNRAGNSMNPPFDALRGELFRRHTGQTSPGENGFSTPQKGLHPQRLLLYLLEQNILEGRREIIRIQGSCSEPQGSKSQGVIGHVVGDRELSGGEARLGCDDFNQGGHAHGEELFLCSDGTLRVLGGFNGLVEGFAIEDYRFRGRDDVRGNLALGER